MALTLLEPPPSNTPSCGRLPFTERGALRLFVRRESFFSNLRESLTAIAAAAPKDSLTRATYFRREANPLRQKYSGPSAGLSVLAHCAIVALLVYLPPLIPVRVSPVERPPSVMETIYYRIPVRQLPKASQPLPSVSRHRTVARSAAAKAPQLPSPPKSTLAAIVSKPSHPDNFRQTIYQSAAPPDLIIKSEQKLPNIVILQHNQQTLDAPLTPSYAKPAAVARSTQADPAPMISGANSPNVTGAILQLTDNDPKLTIPVAGGGEPTARPAASVEGPPESAPDLVAVGVNPSNAANQLSLPNGNRWGEFSVTPPAQTGGSGQGVPGKGNDTRGKETGESGNAEHGISGTAGAAGPVDIAGATSGAPGLLSSALAVNLVYPVVQPINGIRRNTMVISTGPIGGGGLNVYGALNCGKIYSIFLPMPGRNWSLQYCDRSSSKAAATAVSQTQVLRLDSPLLPPDVDLNQRYNFKRIPVPPPNTNRPIILKGVIEADGTVQELTIYRGVLAEMDEAARIAFGRWRFKPAMRDGKPVAVDILVGIPPATGQDYVNR